MSQRFLIEFNMAPGDVSMLTSLVRDLKLTHGERYSVDVRTNFPGIWRNNHHLTPTTNMAGVQQLSWSGRAYREQLKRAQGGEQIHFVRAFHDQFERDTKIHVPLRYPRPDIHLTDEEKAKPLVEGRYWILVPGGKLDITTKIWAQSRWQAVADAMRSWGLRLVQEGSAKRLDIHPPLSGVLNLVGMTSIRDLLRNIYHADGVVCGITSMMHFAAAFEKPCVVIAGGREEPYWEAYNNDYPGAFGPKCSPVTVPHRYLHTCGLIPCCPPKETCWRRRVVPLDTGNTEFNKRPCPHRMTVDGQIIPRCLDMITVDHVLEAVMSYYEEGYLPPPQHSTRAGWQRTADFQHKNGFATRL